MFATFPSNLMEVAFGRLHNGRGELPLRYGVYFIIVFLTFYPVLFQLARYRSPN